MGTICPQNEGGFGLNTTWLGTPIAYPTSFGTVCGNFGVQHVGLRETKILQQKAKLWRIFSQVCRKLMIHQCRRTSQGQMPIKFWHHLRQKFAQRMDTIIAKRIAAFEGRSSANNAPEAAPFQDKGKRPVVDLSPPRTRPAPFAVPNVNTV
ncbi:hypothetical protein CRG98_005839 [Punica granatum]|uniref:Uncharacterized protein n=1 Tax=Punica granatum TaxID=22663 RepID=A0A2I0KZ72_PUNGR|nr:hypothetical protein CRG98_005839 [Punica granatum]